MVGRRGFVGLSLLGVAAPLLPRGASAQASTVRPLQGLTPPSVRELVAKVEAVYDPLTTFRASFKQRYSIVSHGKRKDSEGSVVFERPDKMSWDYAHSGNRVVLDGQLVRIYEKQTRQLFQAPLGSTQYLAALSFLLGQPGSWGRAFEFRLIDAAQLKYTSGYVLRGTPRQPTAAFARVFYYVDAKTFLVRRVLIEDQQRNRNRYDFEKPLFNAPVPPGTFVLNPPPGARVITVPGPVTARPAGPAPSQLVRAPAAP